MVEDGPAQLFDLADRLPSLSALGDPLEALNGSIPREEYRGRLAKAREKERRSKAGRPAFDVALMFKVLILKTLYNLADGQVEYQIHDRLLFSRFLGLGIEDQVPDVTRVWRFGERLRELELTEVLFDRFDDFLAREGFQAKAGQIVDASIVAVPIQRNRRKENAQIKAGDVPADWSEAKREKKVLDARWTKKNDKSFFGYQNHTSVDAKHKLVRSYKVTSANVHDSQVLAQVLDPDNEDPQVWADSTYRSEETETNLAGADYESRIHEKGQANRPLGEAAQALKRARSKVRARVEHVFGSQENSLRGKPVRTIGLARAEVKIGLMNLAYNFQRYLVLIRPGITVPAVT